MSKSDGDQNLDDYRFVFQWFFSSSAFNPNVDLYEKGEYRSTIFRAKIETSVRGRMKNGPTISDVVS